MSVPVRNDRLAAELAHARRRRRRACGSTASRRSSPAPGPASGVVAAPARGRAPCARRRPRGCARSVGGRHVGDVEEVRGGRHARVTPTCLAAGARQRGRQPRRGRCAPIASRTSLVAVMISGGSRRTTLSPAPTTSRPSARASATKLGVRRLQLEAEQQALAADLLDDVGMLVLRARRATGLQPQRHLARRGRGSPAPARRRARHCRPPWPADCRRRSSRGVPGVMPVAASSVARQAPIGKPPPMPLAIAMMSGVTPDQLIGEELAGAADAGLDLVEDQQQAVLVAERRAGRAGIAAAPSAAPPSPWIGSIMIAAVSGVIAAFSASWSPNGTWSKPSTLRAEALEVLLLAAGGDRRQRAAVEGALEGDDAEALGLALRRSGTCRAILMAHSIASAPELVKKTRSAKVAVAEPRAPAAPARESRRDWRCARASRPGPSAPRPDADGRGRAH